MLPCVVGIFGCLKTGSKAGGGGVRVLGDLLLLDVQVGGGAPLQSGHFCTKRSQVAMQVGWKERLHGHPIVAPIVPSDIT